MSFPTDLSVYNAAAPTTASVYMPLGTADGNTMIRISPTTTLAVPTTLRLSHKESGRAPAITDEHLIQHRFIKLDAAGVQRTSLVNLTARVDRQGAFTQAEIENQISIVLSVLLGTGTGSLLNNTRVRDWLLNQV